MIRIAICDDSNDFLSRTKSMIDNWKESPVRLTAETFSDGDALISAHAQNPFDVILLDIVMPLMNGIETARELREKDKRVKIVFLSSSREYGVDTYTVKASNYLLKPVETEAFFNCLTELLEETRAASRSITVKGIDAIHNVGIADIEFVESQGKHIIFHASGARRIESADPLYAYEKILTVDDGFFKCHRSYIVNIHYIDSYTHTGIVLRSGQRVPISRSCQKLFEATYFSVMFGREGDDK